MGECFSPTVPSAGPQTLQFTGLTPDTGSPPEPSAPRDTGEAWCHVCHTWGDRAGAISRGSRPEAANRSALHGKPQHRELPVLP